MVRLTKPPSITTPNSPPMKDKAMKKGTYVSRAVFAKQQAEIHRLKKDIYTLVMGSMPEAILLKEKYRKEFEFWNEIKTELKKLAEKELPKLRAKLDSNPKAFK